MQFINITRELEMIKTIIKLLPFFVLLSVTFARNADKTQIINSGEYYYGTGISYDINEAKDQALEELTSQIAIKVVSSYRQKTTEGSDNLDIAVESIIKTHSAATLKNVHTIKHPADDGRIEVFCYLDKSKVQEIFNERKKLIAEMVNGAKTALSEQNIGNALKLYYFAAILLNSLPDQNVIYKNVNYYSVHRRSISKCQNINH